MSSFPSDPTPGAAPRTKNKLPAAWRRGLKKAWPAEFEHGYLTGLTGKEQKPCGPGVYPEGFHEWPLERRNAWFAGCNVGIVERKSHGR